MGSWADGMFGLESACIAVLSVSQTDKELLGLRIALSSWSSCSLSEVPEFQTCVLPLWFMGCWGLNQVLFYC